MMILSTGYDELEKIESTLILSQRSNKRKHNSPYKHRETQAHPYVCACVEAVFAVN